MCGNPDDTFVWTLGSFFSRFFCSRNVSWWKGQNTRTKLVGMFPSELVDSGLKRGSISQNGIFVFMVMHGQVVNGSMRSEAVIAV